MLIPTTYQDSDTSWGPDPKDSMPRSPTFYSPLARPATPPTCAQPKDREFYCAKLLEPAKLIKVKKGFYRTVDRIVSELNELLTLNNMEIFLIYNPPQTCTNLRRCCLGNKDRR